MVGELALRFVIGGVIVSLFAVLGELVRPQSFAGLFGAATSVALATLGLAFLQKGGAYAALEGPSMLVGAVAMVAYNALVAWLLRRRQAHAIMIAGLSWALWFAVTFVLWAVLLRSA
jgi:hypothetical protein